MLPDLWLSRPQGRRRGGRRRHTSQKVQKPLEAAEPCLHSERLAWDPHPGNQLARTCPGAADQPLLPMALLQGVSRRSRAVRRVGSGPRATPHGGTR